MSKNIDQSQAVNELDPLAARLFSVWHWRTDRNIDSSVEFFIENSNQEQRKRFRRLAEEVKSILDFSLKEFVPAETEKDFREYLLEWKRESPKASLLLQKVALPSYQNIIGLGKFAVPLILKEMMQEQEPDDWFWALDSILPKAKPTNPEDAGQIHKMADSWIEWGKREGYV